MPSPGHRLVTATAADLFGMAEEFVRRGSPDRAEALLELLARNPDSNVRNEARYRQSLLLEKKGQERDAAVLWRRILDEKPGASAVRLKLATTLQKMGDEESALRELRALRSADLPLNVARFVDRMSASLKASKPLGFQFEFALAPDSNINRATRSDTLGTVFGDFTLDPGTKAKSGVGAAVRGLAYARLPLSDGLNLAARASGEANLYRHKDFNEVSLDVSAGPEFRSGRNRFSAEAGVGLQWYGMKPYQRSLRLSGSAIRAVDSVSQVRLDGSARWIDNRLNDLQDGRGLSARVRYERALSPVLLVAASIGGDRFAARDGAYSTRSWSAGATVYREIGRMTASAGFEVGRLKADTRLQLLPAAREDRLTRFQFGAVFRHLTFVGFAPMTRLSIERNRSTVELYDYKRIRTEVGISRAF
jgi:tetratricopeptide (TPR) repeat protein